MNCEGSACSVVEITWDGPLAAYRVRNHSDRPVFVTFTSNSGDLSVRLDERGDAVVPLAQFDLPYRALFCDK
jgi:hypothetical protein